MGADRSPDWDYIREGMEAEGHTPIYKMHKYFARRPQNVFAALIENYSREGDVVFDPFCGGGVTLVEGAAAGRRVVANDINPLAAFISRCEAEAVSREAYLEAAGEILEEVRAFAAPLFLTRDRDTGKTLPARWYEWAYEAVCPACGERTDFSNARKAVEKGKIRNGWYQCRRCGEAIQAVSARHVSSRMLSVTYKPGTRATQRTAEPQDFDLEVLKKAEGLYREKVNGGGWFIPRVRIPEDWDRQREDCLIRKGFTEFSDFFTRRSLLVMSCFLQRVRSRKGRVPEALYRLLLLTFSATLRYTNNMTISTSAWQDGRPAAWAKHAYWMSYQYVEVNPVEYIEKRIAAIRSALACQREKFPVPPVFVEDFAALRDTPAACMQLNQDSGDVPLPDESVDLVLTDPPYGGNVQYGELSAFWLAWIHEDLGLPEERVTDLAGEILVQRKSRAKTLQTYYEGLRRVYGECWRVLKRGRPMVFTFNSKDARVWLAVLKAALDAGFTLEPEGVIYQSPIEIYKNTAHTMASGTVHGDFIYTFVKPLEGAERREAPALTREELEAAVESAIGEELRRGGERTVSQLYIAALRRIIPLLARLALSEEDFRLVNRLVSGRLIEDAIQRTCVPAGGNLWKQGEDHA